MSKIQVRCPNGHKINAPLKYAGRQIECPKCGDSLVIPQPDADQAPSAFGGLPDLVEAPPATPPGPMSDETNAGELFQDLGPQDPLAISEPTAGFPDATSSAYAPKAKSEPVKETKKKAKPGETKVNLQTAAIVISAITVPSLLIAGGLFWAMAFLKNSDNAAQSADDVASDVELRTTAQEFAEVSPVLAAKVEQAIQSVYDPPAEDLPAVKERMLRQLTELFPKSLSLAPERDAALSEGEEQAAELEARIQDFIAIYRQVPNRARPMLLDAEEIPSELRWADFVTAWRRTLMQSSLLDPLEQTQQLEELLGGDSLFKQHLPVSASTRAYYQLRCVRELLEIHRSDYGFPSLGGLPLCETNELSWRVALCLAQPELVPLDVDPTLSWDDSDSVAKMEQIPKFYATLGVDRGFTCVQGVDVANTAMAQGTETVGNAEIWNAVCVITGPELGSGWLTPAGVKIDSTQNATQLGTPPIEEGYPALLLGGECIVIPPTISGEELTRLFTFGDGWPSENEIAQFPRLKPDPYELLVYRFQSKASTDFSLPSEMFADSAESREPEQEEGKAKLRVIFGFDGATRAIFNDYLEAQGYRKGKRGLINLKVLGKLNGAAKKFECAEDEKGDIPFPREMFREYVELFESGTLFETPAYAREIPSDLRILRQDYMDGNLSEVDTKVAFIVFAAYLLPEIYAE